MPDILTGLLICDNSVFRSMFEHLKQNADLYYLEVLHTIGPNDTTFKKIEAILDKAANVYNKLFTAKVWIKPSCGAGNMLNSLAPQVKAC